MSHPTSRKTTDISLESLKDYSVQKSSSMHQLENLRLQLKAEKQRDKEIYQTLKKRN